MSRCDWPSGLSTCKSARFAPLWLLFFLVVMSTVAVSSSLTTTRLLPSEQFPVFHRITVNDGLSQGSVIFVHQDRTGFLWFGSAGGLDRYDGMEFKNCALIGNVPKRPVYFYSCIENPDSTFWLSTDVGLILFDPVTVSGELFSLPRSIASSESGTIGLHLTKLRDGSLLLGVSSAGLVRFDINTHQFSLVYAFKPARGALPQEDMAGIQATEDGNALVVTYDHILLYDSQQQTTTPLASFADGRRAQCVLPEAGGDSLLIGTSKGMLRFDGKLLSPVRLSPDHPQLDSVPIKVLYRDSKGTLWIGLDDGAVAFTPGQNALTFYQHNPADPTSILPGGILTIKEDRSENLWFGIHDQGLCRIDLKREKFFTIENRPGFPRQLPSEAVWGLAVDAHRNLWISGEGLAMVNRTGGTVTLHNSLRGSSSANYARNTRRVYALNDSLVCVIADRRVYVYNILTNGARELSVEGKPLADVYRAHVRERSRNLLCVSSDSVFEVDPVRGHHVKTLFIFARQGAVPPSASVAAMIDDTAGNVWFGTNYGLLHYNDRSESVRLLSEQAGGVSGIPAIPMLSLALGGENTLWVGSQSGLYKYTFRDQRVRYFGVNEGLPNDKIWSIVVDHHNAVWVGTNRGLARIQELPHGKAVIRSYTVADGLPSNEFGMGVSAMDRNGTIYMGGLGVVYFHPDSLQDNPHQPAVSLTGLKIYGVPVPLEREISYLQRLTIPHEKKVFSVTYAALDFTDASRNRYQYKMQGYDDHWVDADTRREAFFTNLDPGTYTFLVRASNNDHVWSDTPLAVEITIVPPFWMTWWFRGILVVAIIGAGGATIRYLELRKIKRRLERVEQERALERERTRISRDMHDDLGANLTSLSMLAEVARMSLHDREKTDARLQRISSLSTDVVRSLDEIVWAVNPGADHLGNLTAYLSEFAQEFLASGAIRIRFEFDSSLPDLPLSSEQRHNIFLVVKEALTNVVKHARATEVRLSLGITGDVLWVEVQDNGQGMRDSGKASPGNGVRNMRQRIESIGGRFSMRNAEPSGAVVRLEVRIPSV